MNTISLSYEEFHEKKKHTDNYFPYNTYICTIPLDFLEVSPHWHNEVELIIVKVGTCTIRVGATSYTVNAGDIVLILPGQIHSIYQYENQDVQYENILFKKEFLCTNTGDLCTYEYLNHIFTQKKGVPSLYTPSLNYYDALYSHILSIDQLCDARPHYYQLKLKILWLDFFYTLLINSNSTGSLPSDIESLTRVKEILLFMQEHFQEDIVPETVAKHFNISTSHFMRIIKQHTGLTFTQYLNSYRLACSAKLLEDKSLTILEISEQCGFTNISYFNRLFKKKYALSPSGYRNTIGLG